MDEIPESGQTAGLGISYQCRVTGASRTRGASALSPGRLILASRSPQRRAILEQLGIQFEVRVPDVDELQSGPAHEVALENAYRKATAIARDAADSPVLGVDTVVSAGPRIHGKPASAADARAMLAALSGRRHAVISGVCLVASGATKMAAATTLVDFRVLDDRLIDWYLNTEEWRERAGGYAIQGHGAALVARIEGEYCNVVGLPVTTLLELMPGLLTGT